jgi:hypothetical protein
LISFLGVRFSGISLGIVAEIQPVAIFFSIPVNE